MAHATGTKPSKVGKLMAEAARRYHAGDLPGARRQYRRVLVQAPRHQAALSELGAVCFLAGDVGEAETLMRRAIAVQSPAAVARFNLAVLLTRTGRFADAVPELEACIAADPSHAAAHALLGDVLHDAGADEAAFAAHFRAVTLSPGNDAHLGALARDLNNARFSAHSPDVEPILQRIVRRRAEAPQVYAGAVFSYLLAHPALVRLADRLEQEPAALYAGCVEPLVALPLLHEVLAVEIVRDIELERRLAALRRGILAATLADTRQSGDGPLAVALGLQSFLNEFVMAESIAETEAVVRVVERLRRWSDLVPEARRTLLTAAAMYRPLGDLADVIPFDEIVDDPVLGALVVTHVVEPAAERELARTLPRLGAIRDATSVAVREQYEANPYPRWTVLRAPGPVVPFRQRVSDAAGPEIAAHYSIERPEILVAGCGTGKHALQTAESFRTARITALDISRASLAYAARKTREAGVDTIRYVHGDILDCGQLETRFDLVESIGVLHHMVDPLAGWRALTGVLQPRGLMKIGLYSGHARRRLDEIRAHIRAEGLAPDLAGIRACRQHVQAAAVAGDAGLTNLSRTQDFCSTSGCRDLLFHVQEQVLDLATIGRWLDELGLEFLGFEFPDRVELARASREAAAPKDLRRLEWWHDYERAHRGVFSGMYVFWCRARA